MKVPQLNKWHCWLRNISALQVKIKHNVPLPIVYFVFLIRLSLTMEQAGSRVMASKSEPWMEVREAIISIDIVYNKHRASERGV